MTDYILLSNLGTKILRWIFFALDTAVYYLSTIAYKVFDTLAGAELLNDHMVKTVTNRVYAIIGVVMIFVIAFNLLNYIIDPDKINDKKFGAATLIKDVLIALIVMQILPITFNKLYSLQYQIINSGVISNLILGGQTTVDGEKYDPSNGANVMVANTFTAFFFPAGETFTSLECNLEGYSQTKYCVAYNKVLKTGNIQAFKDIYTSNDYTYYVVVSTVAGVALLFFLLSFALNMAIRVGKLALLELIAPVPLALEILPNKKGVRQQWINLLVQVYLEAFLYLAVIYLVIFMISLIPDAIIQLWTTVTDSFSLVRLVSMVILIFGLLQFAKQAPQMIMDLFGIKGSGSIAAAFKRAGAMGGVAANTIGSTIGNTVRGATENKGWKRVGGAIVGGASAFGRNLWAGRNAHNWKDAKNNRLAINQGISDRRIQRQADSQLYGGWYGSLKHNIADRYNVATEKLSGTLGYDISDKKFLSNKKALNAYNEYRDLYKGISDIWKNNAEYQMLQNEYKKASISGDAETANKFKQAADAKKAELIQKNATKIADSARKINNFAATHQNVEGFENVSISEEMVLSDALKGTINENLTSFNSSIVGKDYTEIVDVKDSKGNVIYVDALDENGNVIMENVLGKDGQPVLREARDTSGNIIMENVLDKDGNLILQDVRDEKGNIIYEDALDANGNIIYNGLLDSSGNPMAKKVPKKEPVQQPKMEVVQQAKQVKKTETVKKHKNGLLDNLNNNDEFRQQLNNEKSNNEKRQAVRKAQDEKNSGK